MHSGGYYTVEFLKAFLYTSLKYLTMNVYPQQIPRGSTQDCQKRVFGKFPRLVPETLSRFPRQTYGKNKRFLRLLPIAMTNRWHFDNTVTQFENLERNCISYIYSWLGAHTQRMVSGTFLGAWGSFNMKLKNSRTEEKKRQEKSVSVFLGVLKWKHLILNESISSTIVYATRSRRFILVTLGEYSYNFSNSKDH